jgi:hypothetical protein
MKMSMMYFAEGQRPVLANYLLTLTLLSISVSYLMNDEDQNKPTVLRTSSSLNRRGKRQAHH